MLWVGFNFKGQKMVRPKGLFSGAAAAAVSLHDLCSNHNKLLYTLWCVLYILLCSENSSNYYGRHSHSPAKASFFPFS